MYKNSLFEAVITRLRKKSVLLHINYKVSVLHLITDLACLILEVIVTTEYCNKFTAFLLAFLQTCSLQSYLEFWYSMLPSFSSLKYVRNSLI